MVGTRRHLVDISGKTRAAADIVGCEKDFGGIDFCPAETSEKLDFQK